MSESKAREWTINNEDGEPIVEFSSFISLDYRNDGQTVSSTVEEGSFTSYNKVGTPLELDAQLGLEGTDSELQEALDTLTDLQSGTDVVSLVTPDAEYSGMALEAFSYSRKRENGLGVLFVDLSFVEVKEVSAEYTSTTLASRNNRGKVQTNSNTSALAGGLSYLRG